MEPWAAVSGASTVLLMTTRWFTSTDLHNIA